MNLEEKNDREGGTNDHLRQSITKNGLTECCHTRAQDFENVNFRKMQAKKYSIPPV